MSDKRISEELITALNFLADMKRKPTPPDAVSGAATPAQQCSEVCIDCGATDVHPCRYDPENRLFCDECCPGAGRRRNPPEPAATPEAQIPEREQVYVRTGLIRVMYDASNMDDYLATLHAQLAALRVERDQALEVLKESLVHVEELAEAWERGAIKEYDAKGGTRSNRNHDLMIKLQPLARPIPAEPVSRKEVPNGVD